MAVGSLVDAPKDLLTEIKHLEEQFTIGTAKLKEITDHFVNELEKGELALGSLPDSSLTICRSEPQGRQYRESLSYKTVATPTNFR